MTSGGDNIAEDKENNTIYSRHLYDALWNSLHLLWAMQIGKVIFQIRFLRCDRHQSIVKRG